MAELYPMLFGLIGTALMTLALYVVAQAGGDATAHVMGIGSTIPTPHGGSLVPGAGVHVVAGVAFSYAYWALGRAWAMPGPGELVALGVGVGLLRGVAVSILLGLLAFDKRPLERMAASGAVVGLVHVLGTVLYGLCLTVLFGLSGVDPALGF